MTDDFAKDVAAKKARDAKEKGKAKKPAGKKNGFQQPPELAALAAPGMAAAMPVFLAHKECQLGATIHEAGAGYFAQIRFERSAHLFATQREGVRGAATPEHIRDGLETLSDFSQHEAVPTGDGSMGGPNAIMRVLAHMSNANSKM
jgi:hypothetical protein